jgi:Xaa-Pro aminopeptidase
MDAGAETNMHYASDFTRTIPAGGKFTQKQKDIYNIVSAANDLATAMTKPGITYRSVTLLR